MKQIMDTYNQKIRASLEKIHYHSLMIYNIQTIATKYINFRTSMNIEKKNVVKKNIN